MTRRTTWLAALGLSAAPAALVAQATTGTITGRVTDRASGQPIPSAQIQIVGLPGRGAATDETGTFRLANVPAGTYQVRVLRIGFQSATRPVTVTAGGTASVEVAVAASAVNLDQVVVTATGQTQRRRESGVSTSTVDTSRLNLAATQNLSQALAARTPGVVVTSPGGTSGTGSRIRIRGSNSLSLAGEPLLVVDGVFLNNNATNALTLNVGGQTTSRFDDINPDDIESFEVIRGPAATALYGTGAANGVIQITTKRGAAGRTRYTVYGEAGTLRDIVQYPSNYSQLATQVGGPNNGARIAGCNIDGQVRGTCTPRGTVRPDGTLNLLDSLATWNPVESASPFRTGNRGTLGLNVSGGASTSSYFLAGEFEREQGIYDPNRIRRINFRSNLNTQFNRQVGAQVNLSYVRGSTRLPFNDNSAFGLLSQGLLGKAFDCSPSTYRGNLFTVPGNGCGTAANPDSLSRGYFNANVTPRDFFIDVRQQDVSRFVGGATLNWQPASWLTGVLRGGVDLLNQYDQTLTPPNRLFVNQATIEGSRFQSRAEVPSYSTNGTLTATFDLTRDLRSISTVGGQYLDNILRRTDAFGAVLLPGTTSLNGTNARFSVFEDNQRVRTAGAYAEQRFAYRDRLFVSGSIRGDNSSVFGRQVPTVYYPAFNASYVALDRQGYVDNLRFRVGYGRASNRPNFRQATTLFSPVSVRVDGSDVPAVTLGVTGNTDLRPEISAETEGGFDLSTFNGRLSLEATTYYRRTRDLLVSRVLAPSLGATNNQFINLAGLENRGFELGLTGRPVDTRRVQYEINVSATGNRNKLIGLGAGIQPIVFGFNSTQQHRAGYPAGSYFQRTYTFQDLNGDGLISRVNCPTYAGIANPAVPGGPRCEVALSDSVEYLGNPLPTRELNLFQTLGVLNNRVRLTALLNYRGGQKLFNSTREFRCSTTNTCLELHDRTAPLAEQARGIARLMGSNTGYIEDADFVRLAEVGLTLALPERYARAARFGTASVTLAGRNLALFTDYTGFDPEVNSQGGAAFGTADFLAQPPTRLFTARVNFTF